jgi:hypothetical protein
VSRTGSALVSPWNGFSSALGTHSEDEEALGGGLRLLETANALSS